MDYYIKPMDLIAALIAATWRYPEPYNIYNLDSHEESLEELLGGSFYAVFLEDQMIGYYCFGASARIPWAEEKDFYPQGFVDIGLAMRPDLIGRGLGPEFFLLGVDFARNIYPKTPVRLTVACFNHRARKVYQRGGFEVVNRFMVPRGIDFIIMVNKKESRQKIPLEPSWVMRN